MSLFNTSTQRHNDSVNYILNVMSNDTPDGKPMCPKCQLILSAALLFTVLLPIAIITSLAFLRLVSKVKKYIIKHPKTIMINK